MSQRSTETDAEAGTARQSPTLPSCGDGAQSDGGPLARLLSEVERVWPRRGVRRRRIAGLPASAMDLLRPGPQGLRFLRAAAEMDRSLPGWVEVGSAVVAEAAATGLSPAVERACALLGRRPLRQPELLLTALDHSSGEARLWLLVALSGTDTAAVRAGVLHHLLGWASSEGPRPDRAAWFAFLRAFLGGWLEWPVFRDCLAEVGLLAVAADGGSYRPALERLGLWSHPVFAKWYRQVVYEVAHQFDAQLSLQVGGWVRDFPGQDYLWGALDELERKPDSWWPLHILRWVSLPDNEKLGLCEELHRYCLPVLGLVSLVRPDLCAAVGAATEAPQHEQVMRWLLSAGAADALDLNWAEAVLRPWAERLGEPITLAAGALCSLEVPADFAGPEEGVLRRRAFLAQHLVPRFDRVMDNLLYIHALRRCYGSHIVEQAAQGLPTALRALALWPEEAEAAAPLLFRLSREGKRLTGQAAREALEMLRARVGVADLAHLEKRVDLASAWADSGLEGKPARAWWDVGGYHVRLSVAAGKVRVEAYSGPRRLRSLPAKVREDAQYAEIRQARSELAKSYRYFRRRFEGAMVEGLHYPGRDFATLLANPVVRSLVRRLVLMVDGQPFQWSSGEEWRDSPGPEEIVQATGVQIAHPTALWQSGRLEEWQQRVIENRTAQPFKQVFREIYLLGENERAAPASLRFAGYSLAARHAFALLRGRGYAPGDGDAVKEWPGLPPGRLAGQHLYAHIRWARPEEDAGKQLGLGDDAEPVTSGEVWFTGKLGDRLRLEAVSPVILSETLRDADLLVSRAAAGELGFSSEETRRLRATLVRYLARALGLTSVYVSEDEAHVIVEGQREMYRVHLGSGSVLLEKSRLHLDLGWLHSDRLEALVSESMDTLTTRVLGIIGALSHDEQITDPRFLRQLSSHPARRPADEPA